MDIFWTLPPVTRTITASAVVMSALAHTGIIPVYPLLFIPSALVKLPPQIWRIPTSFLLTGSGISIILDPYFLYTYGSDLEKGSPLFTEPGAFFMYIIFVGVLILLSAGLYLGGFVFISPLTLAFAYTFAQENPTRQTGLFILQFEAKFLPWALLFLTFILSGPQAAIYQGTGLLAAHCYQFFAKIWPEIGGGSRWITTPPMVRRWFGGDNPAPRVRDYGTAFPGRQREAPAQGRTSGFSFGGSNWNGRGPGRRLGDS